MKAFQFIAGQPNSADISPATTQKEKEDDLELKNHVELRQVSQKTNKSPSKSIPSTPATRLPLAELIGNIDETKCGALQDESPRDYIDWGLKSPKRIQQRITPRPGKRKRARSSSPVGSSQKNPKTARPVQVPPQIHESVQPFKTTQTDPAASLWNRYAIGTTMETPLKLQFTNLINSSSPHGLDDSAGNVGGLRRWTSCGVEWPSSKSKRRKLRPNVVKEHIEDVFAEMPQGDSGGSQTDIKTSRIGSLLERIQESLVKPLHLDGLEGPSSSSPLPDRNDQVDREAISPCRASELASRRNENCVTGENYTADNQTAFNNSPLLQQAPSSSSFSSDGIDFNAVELMPGVERNNSSHQAVDRASQATKAPIEVVAESGTVQLIGNATMATTDDEFGEDDDLSVTDFDTLVSLYDKKGTQNELCDTQEVSKPLTETKVLTSKSFIDNSVDDFDDDDIDEASLVAAETAATQNHSSVTISRNYFNDKPRALQRYLVVDVSEGDYPTKKSQRQAEKVLLVQEEKTSLYKAITLRQSWFDTRCTKGSYVHVIGNFSETGQITIDDNDNMLILHPDHLISALVVADSFTCIRRAVLQDRVKATSDASPPQFYGTVLHEIFQEALQANRWDDEWLKTTIQTIVSRHIEDLYEIKLSISEAVDHLQSKMPELQSWADLFVNERPRQTATVKDRRNKTVTMSLNKLLDVEEHVWSPMYGLKGNIDATVQVVMQDESGSRTLTVPLEVKTGRNSSNASHQAQTALYTLLLSDRYDIPIEYGILYYMETSEISRIPAIRHEIRHMVMQRNELACYVRERLTLPPMLKNPHACSRCYAKTSCFLYNKLLEDGTGESNGLRDKFDEVVRHLNPADQSFFAKWDDLLTKEESEMMKFRRELWTMTSTERQGLGRCFSNVVLDASKSSEDHSGAKINRFRYTFRKISEAAFSFRESQLTVGEPIVISDEKSHYALAKGYVTNILDRHIEVAVDRRLHNARTRQAGFDQLTNQTFVGLMEVGKTTLDGQQNQDQGNEAIEYRLDKDEFSSGMATVRNNLVQIMTNDVFQAKQIRKLVVDGLEPRFRTIGSTYEPSGPLSQMSVNNDQRAAIEKIMTAQDYALVLGMPGTGKTTTIAHIIRALIAKNKTVLLTSYTHTAVDNILLKIRHDNINVLRLGALSKIHPEVREFAVLGAEPKASIEELEKAYNEPQVVATTCLGINHQVFKERIFDYCIVDEASQITLPVCLGPIRMAKAFVLVGDHYQLPPLVQNREAQEGGLDISLFKLLSERHPFAVVNLEHQYRMNAAIMSLSNTLVYNGRLKCGSDAIASRFLELPTFDALRQLHDFSGSRSSPQDGPRCSSQIDPTCWLNKTLSPTNSPPVVFLNTDSLLPASLEQGASGSRISNPLEASLTIQLVRALIVAGAPASSIGVITFYRSQLALIKGKLQTTSLGLSTSQASQIEAHTADRYQGRDKDVIVLSCVRSNDRQIIGDLLKDWRRVNVAITRAKRKLIIIGSRGTLEEGDELLKKLVRLCDGNGWIIDAPANAAIEDAHCWDASKALFTAIESNGQSPEIEHTVNKGIKQENAPNKSTSVDPLKPIDANIRAGKQRSGGGAKNPNPKFKAPAKVGKVSDKTLLRASGDVKKRRPILADIINDVMGEDFLD